MAGAPPCPTTRPTPGSQLCGGEPTPGPDPCPAEGQACSYPDQTCTDYPDHDTATSYLCQMGHWMRVGQNPNCNPPAPCGCEPPVEGSACPPPVGATSPCSYGPCSYACVPCDAADAGGAAGAPAACSSMATGGAGGGSGTLPARVWVKTCTGG
jgi:hypothetical protein